MKGLGTGVVWLTVALALSAEWAAAETDFDDYFEESSDRVLWPFGKRERNRNSPSSKEELFDFSFRKDGDSKRRNFSTPPYLSLSSLPEWEPEQKPEDAVMILGGHLWPSGPSLDLEISDSEDCTTVFIAQTKEPFRPSLELPEPDFEALPKGYLVDPANLLEADLAQQLEQFLAALHQGSSVELYLVVVDENYAIQSGMSAESLRQRWFEGAEEAVILYPYGNPAKAQTDWGAKLHDDFHQTAMQAHLMASAGRALDLTDPQRQIEHFTTELAFQLQRFSPALQPERQLVFRLPAPEDLIPVSGIRIAPELAAIGPKQGTQSGQRALLAVLLLGAMGWLVLSRSQPSLQPLSHVSQPRTQSRLGALYGGGGHPVVSFEGFADEPNQRLQRARQLGSDGIARLVAGCRRTGRRFRLLTLRLRRFFRAGK